ncbi:helix-turn-helix domain-containing protein [Pontibacillus litoralis]|uniref:XRE family transcriptional regulator n=1 Tax=Pontibacillus litoralis JSM 072002 TaxID=1385512 RepID=A0A0A5FWM8_9BACI|nr:helix-turn-helix transcriptional regulator [Pontibacillus litoralis]KGX85196.1 XRE family transcriptional regulator [Pontibacillus litoralis JSM 072002]
MKTLGARLKELRKEQNLYQTDLAKLLNVTVRQIQRYEKNDNEIPLSSAMFLADYFDVSLDYLTGRSDVRSTQK